MFFSKDKNTDPHQPKRRSVLGALFSPDIGTSVRPIGEVNKVFVNLLALIFAGQGLFPRNHPALMGDPSARLTLSGVLGTAWRALVFRKENASQVLLFFAVAGILGAAGVALIIGLFSLFIGKAHAQGYYSPVSPGTDIALSWIHYLFATSAAPAPMTNYLTPYGQMVPQSSAIQTALTYMFAFYSNAILVVGAIILFYHLASMIVETAHHGVVLGKQANQIWAPIRLVVAIGLLVPIAGGMNSGQFLVVKMAEWGSNLASQTWKLFLTSIAAEPYGSVTPLAPYVRKAVYDTVMMEACAQAYNGYIDGVTPNFDPTTALPAPWNTMCSNPPLNRSVTPAHPLMPIPPNGFPLANNAVQFNYDLPVPILSDRGACGHYTWPAPVVSNDTVRTTVQNGITTNRIPLYDGMRQSNAYNARAFVRQNLQYFMPKCVGGKDDLTLIPNDGYFEHIAVEYASAIQGALTAMSGGTSAQFKNQMQNVAAISMDQGWLSAGAWFNTIARVQGELMDVADIIPGTEAPQLVTNKDGVFDVDVLPTMAAFRRWLEAEDPLTVPLNGPALSPIQQQMYAAEAGFQQEGPQDHVMDYIFGKIDEVAALNGVWQSNNTQATVANGTDNFSLGVQFLGANPLAEIAALGHANLKTAYVVFDSYINFLIATGSVNSVSKIGSIATSALKNSGPGILASNIFSGISSAAEGVGTAVGGVISMICLLFFSSGFMLAFMLPLIPFFRFMFEVVTWVIALLEAVVAVPLIALAHLNPVGEGLPGASAKAAYFFVFNIFLRPVLMIFGLILGLLIFYLAASYMNMFYLLAVAGAGGTTHGHVLLSRVMYSFMYVLILYLTANNAFKMIDWLPQHAMRWMGAQGLTFQNMGDPNQIQGLLGAGAAYADQRLLQAVGGLTGKGGAAFAAKEYLQGRTPATAGKDYMAAVGGFLSDSGSAAKSPGLIRAGEELKAGNMPTFDNKGNMTGSRAVTKEETDSIASDVQKATKQDMEGAPSPEPKPGDANPPSTGAGSAGKANN